jgi:hypothetical protein
LNKLDVKAERSPRETAFTKGNELSRKLPSAELRAGERRKRGEEEFSEWVIGLCEPSL